jgi:hypothetical protein
LARGSKRRILHYDELHDLYSSSYIIRKTKSMGMRWARYVARMEQIRNSYKILMVKPEGESPLGGRSIVKPWGHEWS